jgi:6-phosphogluconolactonase
MEWTLGCDVIETLTKTPRVTRTLPVFAILALAACGSSDAPAAFSIGGMVVGLAGSGLVIENNGGDDLSVSASGMFKFPAALTRGTAYSVTVKVQPLTPSQTCTVANGSGVVGNMTVTAVAVTCTTNTYAVGGTTLGLVGSGLVLSDNGRDDLPISANGSFGFKTPLASGTGYDVTIKTQPSAPSQICTVTGPSGMISSAPVASVTVTCAASTARFVYVNNETAGTISAYSVAASTGSLTPIVGSPFNAGTLPGALFSASNMYLYVCGTSSSSIIGFLVDAASGALSPIAGSPFTTGFHPISGTVSPNGKYAYVIHSGPNDVDIYSIDSASGGLSPTVGSPLAIGTGPTSIAFSPNGQFAYVADTGALSVGAYSADATSGVLTQVAGSPYMMGPPGTSADLVALDATGGFAYVLNAAYGTIWGYSANQSSGGLTTIPGSPFVVPPQGVPPFGSDPADLAIHPSGKFAYALSYALNGVIVYARDVTSGALTLVSSTPEATGSQPTSMALEPSGKYLYVVNSGSNNVSGFSIDPISGGLTPVPGSPFPAGQGPTSISAVQ